MITTATQMDEGFLDKPQICRDCLKNKTVICTGVQTDFEMRQLKSDSPTQRDQYETDSSSIELTKIEDRNSVLNNNNDAIPCDACPRCLECDNKNKHAAKLESDLNETRSTITDLQRDLEKYEDNLVVLQRFLDEGNNKNIFLQAIVQSLQSKIGILEAACSNQKDRIESLTSEKFCAECQTDSGNLMSIFK